MSRCRVALILAAAGGGSRFGAGLPKQYQLLGDRAVICHALAPFLALVDRVVVAVAEPHRQRCHDLLAPLLGGRDWQLVPGGATRLASVARALDACADAELVLVHDAARPLVRTEDVAAVLAALDHGTAAILAEPCAATVKRVDGSRHIVATEDRTQLWLAQTPQGFHTAPARGAFAQALASGSEHTDEAAVLAAAGISCTVVPGPASNLKITRSEDLALALAWLRSRIGN